MAEEAHRAVEEEERRQKAEEEEWRKAAEAEEQRWAQEEAEWVRAAEVEEQWVAAEWRRAEEFEAARQELVQELEEEEERMRMEGEEIWDQAVRAQQEASCKAAETKVAEEAKEVKKKATRAGKRKADSVGLVSR